MKKMDSAGFYGQGKRMVNIHYGGGNYVFAVVSDVPSCSALPLCLILNISFTYFGIKSHER